MRKYGLKYIKFGHAYKEPKKQEMQEVVPACFSDAEFFSNLNIDSSLYGFRLKH